jgi:hypothetical protein
MAQSLEGQSTTPSPTPSNGVQFDLSRVRLNETQKWCYHEGSYGHNPEYGNTHTLTWSKDGRIGEPPYSGDHLKATSQEQNGNFERAPVASVQTFWKIHTSGEDRVPKDVSPTEAIGHSHKVTLHNDELTVTVAYHMMGKEKTTTLSVAALFQQFLKKRKVVEFKY